MIACPYNARHILPRKTNGTPYDHVIDKCTFCKHRVEQGIAPACVTTCQGRARTFGDLNNPESEVAKLVAVKPTVRLKEQLNTRPMVFYVKPDGSIMGGTTSGHNFSAPEVPKGKISTTRERYI
jgi:Fe-S-cluster-containing dehydrogenase component